jgi:hypothetical protein
MGFGINKKQNKNKEEKFKFSIKGQTNPTGEMENEINIEESLHTKVIQRSQYVKIDDNLLNFDFD